MLAAVSWDGSSFLGVPSVYCLYMANLRSLGSGCDPMLRHCACRPGTQVLSGWGFLGNLDGGGSFFFLLLFKIFEFELTMESLRSAMASDDLTRSFIVRRMFVFARLILVEYSDRLAKRGDR